VIRARTVLVIEDDAQIRRAVKTALADSAERIVEAANGHEGLGLAASWRPDLVVLDLVPTPSCGASARTERRSAYSCAHPMKRPPCAGSG
jgi:DNA-binding response OmpR family regulator